MIVLSNISKVFDNGKVALTAVDNVNLTIAQGQIYGIIGYSGAGKSTLIRLLNGLEKPSTGSVTINGQNISAAKGEALRQARLKISMVFQHFNLLRSRTVMDNVCFPLRLSGMPRPDREARAREVLNLVGLADQAHKYPGQLSGGQQQRVGIARALASKPRLLLCDEATSALDPETTQSILRLLGDINHRLGLTIVLITHGMDVIWAVCDRVAVIEGGRIVEAGQVLDVFLHPRHDATRALLSESGLDGGEGWRTLAQGVPGRLLRLSFRGDNTASPLLSRLSRDLGLDLSILQGSVGRIKDTPYGQLVVAAEGAAAGLDGLAPALDAAGVDYEVLRP